MATKTKKSPDNTHKLNRRVICLRAPLALVILLTVFLAPQRSASTQAPLQDLAARDTKQFELINGNEAMPGELIVCFDDTDMLQRQTFMDNLISQTNASVHRRIG